MVERNYSIVNKSIQKLLILAQPLSIRLLNFSNQQIKFSPILTQGNKAISTFNENIISFLAGKKIFISSCSEICNEIDKIDDLQLNALNFENVLIDYIGIFNGILRRFDGCQKADLENCVNCMRTNNFNKEANEFAIISEKLKSLQKQIIAYKSNPNYVDNGSLEIEDLSDALNKNEDQKEACVEKLEAIEKELKQLVQNPQKNFTVKQMPSTSVKVEDNEYVKQKAIAESDAKQQIDKFTMMLGKNKEELKTLNEKLQSKKGLFSSFSSDKAVLQKDIEDKLKMNKTFQDQIERINNLKAEKLRSLQELFNINVENENYMDSQIGDIENKVSQIIQNIDKEKEEILDQRMSVLLVEKSLLEEQMKNLDAEKQSFLRKIEEVKKKSKTTQISKKKKEEELGNLIKEANQLEKQAPNCLERLGFKSERELADYEKNRKQLLRYLEDFVYRIKVFFNFLREVDKKVEDLRTSLEVKGKLKEKIKGFNSLFQDLSE